MRTNTFEVAAIHRNSRTHLTSVDGDTLDLRPYLYLQPGDLLDVVRASDGEVLRVWKSLDSNSRIPIVPAFEFDQTFRVGRSRLRVRIRERQSEEDWRRAKALERYHYRGVEVKFIPGRKSVLVAEIVDGPTGYVGAIAGYVVLASPLPAVSVRLKLMGQSFGEHMRTRTINRFVRIPRVVVAPELRGIGLGKVMANAAVAYAESRWEVGGTRPWAVEVVAAMTDFHPFFERAGFLPLGRTKARPEPILPAYGRSRAWGARPNATDYKFRTFQNSKQYLLYPLRPGLRQKAEKLNLTPHPHSNGSVSRKPRVLVSANHLRCAVTIAGAKSGKAKTVAAAFGLVDAGQSHAVDLFQLRHVKLREGQVVLIEGPSGSGKTTLARALLGLSLPMTFELAGEIRHHERVTVADLYQQQVRSRPLIEQIPLPAPGAVELLNSVGLSEPRLYVTTPSRLSDGQRHRFRLALLVASESRSWLADDFGAPLDDFAASVAARGVAEMARRTGTLLIVTSSSADRLRAAFRPDLTLRIRMDGWISVT